MIKSLFFGSLAFRLQQYLRLMRWLHDQHCIRLATFISRHLERRHGLFIPPEARIAPTCRFPHPTGIVIGVGAKLGDRTTVFQNVTIGAARTGGGRTDRYPKIEADCVIFAGAVLVGDITIGEGSVVGANAVVTRSFPPGSTIVGAPAVSVISRKKSRD
jgi:serine O-acetyltransferase